jgi:D-3-phosphoglycerate dehydrogenase / 2-oxoglutarate reductase
MGYRVVITDDRFGDCGDEKAVLEPIGASVEIADCRTDGDVIAACADADALLLNQAPAGAAVIAALKKCRIISRYGIGYDNVDVASATERGIWVANVPGGYCADEVAEHALALLLSCARSIPLKDRGVRAGQWNINRPIRRIAGRVLGIVGFGHAGRALYEKTRSFGFSRILVTDPHAREKLGAREKPAIGSHTEAVSLETLLEQSDYISLHVPLNATTRGMMGSRAFAVMKEGVILVNTSRGAVIDEAALVGALRSGRVAYCGLDVFGKEPPDPGNPLLSMDNVVLTDHSAYYSEESVLSLKRKTALNAREVLLGRRPHTPVNVVTPT